MPLAHDYLETRRRCSRRVRSRSNSGLQKPHAQLKRLLKHVLTSSSPESSCRFVTTEIASSTCDTRPRRGKETDLALKTILGDIERIEAVFGPIPGLLAADAARIGLPVGRLVGCSSRLPDRNRGTRLHNCRSIESSLKSAKALLRIRSWRERDGEVVLHRASPCFAGLLSSPQCPSPG